MRIAVTGSKNDDVKSLKKRLEETGHEIVTKHPELAISFGGDGSYLYSEMKFPGVPKLIARNKSICNTCEELDFEKVLKKLKNKQFRVVEHVKLEATAIISKKEKKRIACSDVIIRNLEQYHAIRFNLFVNGKQIMPHDEKAQGLIIGDGIVVANTFGSTGYFKSITKKSFTKGIGIALNNTNTDMDSVLTENAEIRFELKRNNAGFSVDNDKKVIILKPGDSVIIKPSVQRARIIKFEK